MANDKKPNTRIYRLTREIANEPAEVTLVEAISAPAALKAYAEHRCSIDVPTALEVARHVRDGAEVLAS